MKKTLSAIILATAMATGAQAAAEPAMFSQEKIDAAVEKTLEQKEFEKNFDAGDKPKKHSLGTGFYVLAGFMKGTTLLDVEMTFRNKGKCEEYGALLLEYNPGSTYVCRDVNPLMDPLMQNGRKVMYPVQAALDIGVLAFSAHQKKKGSKIWWLPMAALSAYHIFGGINNMRQYNNFQKQINELR